VSLRARGMCGSRGIGATMRDDGFGFRDVGKCVLAAELSGLRDIGTEPRVAGCGGQAIGLKQRDRVSEPFTERLTRARQRG
jgi:hypothetical protein